MSHTDIRAAVLRALATVKKKAQIELRDDEPFSVLGLDSLDRMSVLLEVEAALGVTLDGVDPKQLGCINEYAAAILCQMGEGQAAAPAA